MTVKNIGESMLVKDLAGSRYADNAKKKTSDVSGGALKAAVTVSISSDSRDMGIAKMAVESAETGILPDAGREEKISRLRNQYLANNYRPDPEKVAEKLIGAHISEMA